MFNQQAKPSSAISGATPAKSEPRADCIVVFVVSEKHMFHGAKPAVFRTHPMCFVDASATANRMSGVSHCVVVQATDASLDKYAEAPASCAVCATLRKKPVKRFDFWASLKRGVYTN